jgi:hypothetical protein
MTEERTPTTPRGSVARWRSPIEIVAVLIVLGDLLKGIGVAISDLSARAGDNIGGWDLGRAFSLNDVGIVVAALLLLLALRVIFQWPDETPGAIARVALSLALVVAGFVVASAGILVAQPFADQRFVWTAGEKTGYCIVGLGNLLGAIALGLLCVRGFSAVGRRRSVEPVAMQENA